MIKKVMRRRGTSISMSSPLEVEGRVNVQSERQREWPSQASKHLEPPASRDKNSFSSLAPLSAQSRIL